MCHGREKVRLPSPIERRRRILGAVGVRQSYGKRVLHFFSTCQTGGAELCMVSMWRRRERCAHHVFTWSVGQILRAVSGRRHRRRRNVPQ
jgi:hypothetical protein